MKTPSLWWLTFLLMFSLPGGAQTATSTAKPDTAYAITTRDGNSQVWQRTTYETTPTGKQIPHIHKYTEMATGLNHLVNGQWVASKEEIDFQPDGTAAATHGQHQAYFPGDIYTGEIELVTPEGRQLKSRPLGLSYDDGTNTVLIALLTNSVGQVLNPNQVIYTNAFTGVDADLLYTYTKAGFEQDVVLREQPPTPQSLGLNPATARLQVLTEFFDPPRPAITTTTVPTAAGDLMDDNLDFGVMKMVPGKAFLLGADATPVAVNKQWVLLQGRQFLVEEVPVASMANALNSLPQPTAQIRSTATSHTIARHLILPPQRLAKVTTKPMQWAKASLPERGLVLDYNTINGSLTNYTFQGDTTYYISGNVNLYGTKTFEGGTVLKYAAGTSVNLETGSELNWQSSAYRPVVFTAKDDNSVGETVSGSTGNPSGYYANPAINFSEYYSANLSNFRVAYATTGINFYAVFSNSPIISNAQFVNCTYGIYLNYSGVNVRNALFSHVLADFYITSSSYQVNVQNSTIDSSAYLAFGSSTALTLTNSILANITNSYPGISPSGSYNGFYKSPCFGIGVTNTFNPFQSVGGGSYYLTDGCGFFNAGTTNIDPALLAGLQTKTTYPPIVYSNVTISTATTLSPQAQRDNIGNPDLGYHYNPLDYIFGGCEAQSNLTFTAGTAVGWFRTTSGWEDAGYGIFIANQQTCTFSGTATAPCYWVRLYNVQENDQSAGYGPGGLDGEDNQYDDDIALSPVVDFSFTKCSVMANDPGQHCRDDWVI